jgi:hypothetical protein
MDRLWRDAGLTDVETSVITVERTYNGFDDLWFASLPNPNMTALMAKMSPDEAQELKERCRRVLPAAADGSITYPAWANAVKGRVAA